MNKEDAMDARKFEEVGAAAAILAGVVGFIYSISFVTLGRALSDVASVLTPATLLLGGLLTTAVAVLLQQRLRYLNQPLVLWITILALLGAAGAIIHGGYDLANATSSANAIPTNVANTPNAVDPRGLLTFGVTSLAIFGWSWLLKQDRRYPSGLASLGLFLGGLLLFTYLCRLILVDVTNPIVAVPILLTGFVINPLWYIWLGKELHKTIPADTPAE